MPYILVRHKVEDFDTWKPGYEDHGVVRGASGCKGSQIMRNADDPNEVTILLEWDNLDNARKFAQSDDLREAMQRVGVVGQPDVYFLNEAGRTSR